MWKALLISAFAAGLVLVAAKDANDTADTDDTGCNGDLNARSGCGVNCGRTCSTYQQTGVACPAICYLNACDCKEGFVFDDAVQKCVLPTDCYTVGASGIVNNNASDSVTDTAAAIQDTADFSDTQGTLDTSSTSDNQGTSDTLRTSDNQGTSDTLSTLDTEEDSSDNEEVTSDSSNPSDTEGTLNVSLEADDTGCDANDTAAVTDDTGCNGDPNAQSGCGVNCGRTCSTYQQTGVACPAICYLNACDCKAGFVFDNAVQKCVLPRECSPVCGPSEIVSDCANSGCGPFKCTDLGKPQLCIDVANCTKGCVCQNEYLRADNGTCVPKDQFPGPCGGDPNAKPGCGVNCGKTCSTYKAKNPICPRICKVNGCDCKDNFVFDDAVQKCVLPGECSAKCTGQNEFFDECISGCSNQTCADIGKIFHCPIQPAVCRTGCRCKSGFWRNSDNVCVPESQCPTPTCPDREIYSRCPTVKCEGDYCPKTRNSPLTCPVGIVCDPPRCVCGFNSHRERKTGKCIATAACREYSFDRMQASKGNNVIISAFSVFTPLAQLALYATGDSLKQLLTVLNANSQDDIRTNFPALTASYEGQTSVIFNLAAKVYSSLKYKLSDSFKNDTVNVFNAESQEINFGDSSKAADTINQWVASKTNNRITDLVSRDMFSEDTRIALVNAILFKGTWLYQFDAKNTQDQPFYLEDGTNKTTKLMYQEATLKYGEDDDFGCKILEMYYKGRNFSMVVVLPNNINGVTTLAEKLQDSSVFNKIIGTLRSQKVKVWLPKFEIKTKTDLSDILKKQNVTKIFGADAGLEGILAQPQDVYISTAVQDAIIIVNEEGSEAAAANAFVGPGAALPSLPPPPPKIFKADRAFLYYLKSGSTVVFSGVFYN